jgi:hypothetical protein
MDRNSEIICLPECKHLSEPGAAPQLGSVEAQMATNSRKLISARQILLTIPRMIAPLHHRSCLSTGKGLQVP